MSSGSVRRRAVIPARPAVWGPWTRQQVCARCRYGYNWKEAEAEKNLLRTHTTAVSSRMLYKLAQSGFQPSKLFSVDRVFRNEAIDRTHLAEFHQIEGLVCDRGLTLGDLIGTLHTFFERLGLKKIRFKPAYNPYTEPSMEIFRPAPPT